MTGIQDVQTQLRAINQSAAFNRWCGLEVKSASAGQVELVMPWLNCLRPAQGEHFIARARVVRAGKTQVFTACELFAVALQAETLVATGETLLSVATSGA